MKGEWVDAKARLLDDPEILAAQKRRAVAKYGVMVRLMSLIVRLTEPGRVDVVIEIQ